MRRVKIIGNILILIISFTNNSYSQSIENDTIYLKNGSKLVGDILENAPEKSIRFRLTENNTLIIPYTNLDSVNSNTKNMFFNRVFNITELGVMTGKSNKDDTNHASFTFQTFFGYKWSSKTGTGIGIAVDNYEHVTMVPLFMGNRGELLNRNVKLYYYLDMGYGFALKRGNNTFYGNENVKAKGGYMFSPGAGLKFKMLKGDVIISAGYKWQQSEFKYEPWETNQVVEKRSSNRMVFRVGVWL